MGECERARPQGRGTRALSIGSKGFGVGVSQIPPGQQPPYPQGYPQQAPGQAYAGYPQGQYPYSPYQMPQVHAMAYAAQMQQGWGGQFLRAGMMLIITGTLVGLCGIGCGAMAAMPLEQMMAEAPMDPQVAAVMTPQMMKLALIVLAVGSVIYAALAIVFGVMVRKQSRGATIGGIVITSIILAYLLFNMAFGAVQVARMGPQGFVGICVMVVPMVVGAWQLTWLIQALRSGGQLRAMQNQMQMQQMQYWQMMAMQQGQQQQQQMMMAAQQQGQGTRDMRQGQEPAGPAQTGQEPPATPPTA